MVIGILLQRQEIPCIASRSSKPARRETPAPPFRSLSGSRPCHPLAVTMADWLCKLQPMFTSILQIPCRPKFRGEDGIQLAETLTTSSEKLHNVLPFYVAKEQLRGPLQGTFHCGIYLLESSFSFHLFNQIPLTHAYSVLGWVG